MYRENSSLVAFNASGDEGADEASLVAAIRAQKPIVVVDESHNATTELSVDMIRVLSPRFVLELTATPHPDSNIVSIAEPAALKREEMVKLPVIVLQRARRPGPRRDGHRHEAQARVAGQGRAQLRRPIHQAHRPLPGRAEKPRRRDDLRRVKEKLLSFGIPEAQVKIKTAEVDELEGLDLMSESCPVRYVITVNALKEGWDCPFAYVLASWPTAPRPWTSSRSSAASCDAPTRGASRIDSSISPTSSPRLPASSRPSTPW